MDTAPKKRMGKPLKVGIWIASSVVGLFVIITIIGSIAISSQPGGWDAEMSKAKQEQASKESAAAADEKKQADERERAEAKEVAETERAEASAQAKESKAAAETAEKAKQGEDRRAKAKAEEQAKADAAAKKKAAAEAAKTPEDRAASAAGVEGLAIHQEGGNIFAEFPISENFSNNLMAIGAQADTVDILKAVRENMDSYERVFVQGTFPMADEYGNTDDSIILNAGYEKSTLEKINFEGIVSSDIWTIRDSGMVHSEIGG